MFFLYNLERQVTLHPSYFGRNMHELVTGKLLKDVEGTCTGRYYIITIMDAFNISEGRILPGSGLAEFTVGYRAVVWRPFKGETVRNGRRGTTVELSLCLHRLMPLSPRSIRSASLQMLDPYHSLFLRMQVQQDLKILPWLTLMQLIPSDIKFDPNATPPQFTNNEDMVIEVGTHVRVKLIGTRAEVGSMYAIASIKEDFLG